MARYSVVAIEHSLENGAVSTTRRNKSYTADTVTVDDNGLTLTDSSGVVVHFGAGAYERVERRNGRHADDGAEGESE